MGSTAILLYGHPGSALGTQQIPFRSWSCLFLAIPLGPIFSFLILCKAGMMAPTSQGGCEICHGDQCFTTPLPSSLPADAAAFVRRKWEQSAENTPALARPPPTPSSASQAPHPVPAAHGGHSGKASTGPPSQIPSNQVVALTGHHWPPRYQRLSPSLIPLPLPPHQP